MMKATFNIFDSLSEWSKTLPAWQHFLLSKLVEKSELSDSDLDQIFVQFLAAHDLGETRAPHTVWEVTLPKFQEHVSRSTSHLAAISHVTGVNALVPGEKLVFGPKLTVVYGPNGAGKSGYARILKSSCFTRSKSIGILGDVSVAKSKQEAPSARFTFEDGSTVDFVHPEPCPQLRDSFAVFDSTCVRVHLDDRNAFQVVPYLFDVFPRMIACFGEIQSKLREQIKLRTPDAKGFAIPNSDSEVAQALANLTARTDLIQLRALAEWTELDAATCNAIDRSLAELRGSDPEAIIKKNEQRIADLSAVHLSLELLSQSVSAPLAYEIAEKAALLEELEERAEALSASRFESEPVQPVGTRAWLALINAAIAFGKEAYPDTTLPPSVEGAQCLLCHQKLDACAADRLTNFYQVATSDVESQREKVKGELESQASALRKLALDFFANESAAKRTAQELDADLTVRIDSQIEGYRAVVGALIDALAEGRVPMLSVLSDEYVSTRLASLVDQLKDESEKLRKGKHKDVLDSTLAAWQLLQDRKVLAASFKEIEDAVSAFNWVERAEACIRNLPTTQREVTSKQKALAQELLAKGFIERFEQNCKELQLTLPVQFKFAGEAGTTGRKIELANAEVRGVEPSQVLSEGEQTAAALADFLTEIELNGACVGVILDDPVTSMDHMRKEAIAKRLVREAQERQVIVFTHDILFTNYLATEAEQMGVGFAGRTVWRNDVDEPGAIDRLAFPHEYYEGAAYDRARLYFEASKKAVGASQRAALEKACGNLRTAYEDFIQKTLFNNVVRRWRENIAFTVDKIYFDEGVAARVAERMARLSRYIDAHSHSAEFHQVPLTLDIVADELSQFELIKGDYRKARKAWEEAKPTAKNLFG